MQIALHSLDYLFHFLHLMAIVINTTFWCFPRTLRWAQITLSLTVISWFGFGSVYGWGYCFLTDWQWRVKEALGESNLPSSYITYLLNKLGYVDIPLRSIDIMVAIVVIVSCFGCLIQTIRKGRRG